MGYKLLFSIVNQNLIREDNIFLINKTQRYVEAEFTFKTSEWDNLEKYAMFSIKGRNFMIPLGDSKICTTTVPKEALKTTNFKISVFGGEILTTNAVKILLGESGYSKFVTPTCNGEPEDIFKVIRRKLSKKFDEIEFKNNNMICYSDGEIVSIVPITASLLENYYTKEEIENSIEETRSNLENQINDLDTNLRLYVDELGNVTEEKLSTLVSDIVIEENEDSVFFKLIKYGEDLNG